VAAAIPPAVIPLAVILLVEAADIRAEATTSLEVLTM
jgi:hypothetical protein